VEAAFELFAANGYHGCSMRDLALGVGIGTSLLYRYFPSKLDVLRAVVELAADRLCELSEALSVLAQESTGLRDFLLAAGTVHLDHMERLHPWYAIWFSAVPLPAEQHRAIVAAQEGVFRTVARGLAKRGEWRDPYVTARTFTGALGNLVMFQERARLEAGTSELRSVFLGELVEALGSPHRVQ
jgi:AcrR family transcriptional regulator